MRYLSTKFLRADHQSLHFFGLGFIQVKLNQFERVHFYHPDLPAFVEQPHDHRYNFISHVRKGLLENTVWEETSADNPVATLERYTYTTCKKSDSSSLMEEERRPASYPIYLQKVGTFTVNAGSSHFMSKNTFHTVKPDFSSGPVVTYITRTAPEKDEARIIQTEAEMVCPFSKVLTDDELWAYIAKCLGEA